MARRPREDYPGATHHVYARGNGLQEIFLDDADRRTYLSMLGRVVARMEWRCLAYCLMSNHMHLLLETPSANLGAGMQYLHGFYAQTFNQRHSRSGHLFQGRYGAVRIEDDPQLWATVRYIAHNPVEAGFSASAIEWPWSSHRAVVRRDAPAWLDTVRLLSYFTAHGGDGRRRYVELIQASAVA